jgi:triacylglycerol lipase
MSQALMITSEPRSPVPGIRHRDVRPQDGPIGCAVRLARRLGHVAMVQALEVRLMASIAARTPLRLIGGGFDDLLSEQTLAHAQREPTTRPVLLVHGFGGTKSSWSCLARTLRSRGLIFDAISYTPFGTSVEEVADQLAAEVAGMLSRTGADKVHLVGHSLGGVVIAEAIASGRLTGQVDTVITLGTPFGGSPWAHLFPFGAITRALRGDSPLLRRIARAPLPAGVRWLAFTAALDMIVPGPRSVPPHPEAETVRVGDVGHLGMLLSQQVVGRIVVALAASGCAGDDDSCRVREFVHSVASGGRRTPQRR